ncbi:MULTISPECIES: hypothetical protein [unclassified Rhodococcus (in: high G+C Gram-positive bacteria)]|jgi:hypothetical protein|uniref:hypothetical protein n=1 Tax=unclassified Rhodococcus (in: high G+C Gram-positive bacteria) TaxID=192944 RepID=UPI001583F183|nr:hypothetical protein [Rhodococcus sp. W8901]QKT10030.1 hypothetical protein HUN07_04270 [Rhodococcus sp. W8901]
MSFEDVRDDAQFVRFADGEWEGRRTGYDDGALSVSRPSRLLPFLQWASIASSALKGPTKAMVNVKAYASGGEVEDEHGPTDAGGFLSTAPVGSLFPFLQWHNWYNIYKGTRDEIVSAGGEAAITAMVGAVTGPAVAATAGAATALTSTVSTVVQTLSSASQNLRQDAPKLVQPRFRTPVGRMSPEIDRSTTINVIKTAPDGATFTNDPLRERIATYLSHVR